MRGVREGVKKENQEVAVKKAMGPQAVGATRPIGVTGASATCGSSPPLAPFFSPSLPPRSQEPLGALKYWASNLPSSYEYPHFSRPPPSLTCFVLGAFNQLTPDYPSHPSLPHSLSLYNNTKQYHHHTCKDGGRSKLQAVLFMDPTNQRHLSLSPHVRTIYTPCRSTLGGS